jgi:hypothetical protein
MIQLSDAAVIANNEAVAIIPNTLTYTEGLGEDSIRAASSGGGKVEQIWGRNLESAFSSLKFELPTTADNIALVRSWKVNNPSNVFQIAGTTAEGDVTRTFTQASVANDPEIGIAGEGVIAVEITSNPAI